MKLGKQILLGVFGLALQGTAAAQIYESKDAEGVPEFSDTPSAGSEVVDLQKTNVADEPPEIPEMPQAEAQRPASPAPADNSGGEGEIGEPSYDVYGGAYNDEDVRVQRQVDEDRIDNALPGHNGPGVGAPGVGVEPHPVEGEPGRHEAPAGGAHVGGGAGGRR
jgi:hypothetical protein